MNTTPETKKECCIKCLMDKGFSGFPHCIDSTCSCHTPETENVMNESDSLRVLMERGHENTANNFAEKATPETEWEAEK